MFGFWGDSRGSTKEVKIAIELWIEAAKKEGREIPKPMGKELLKNLLESIAVRT